jgi:hypothetical protein
MALTACPPPDIKGDTATGANAAPALTVDTPAPGVALDAGDPLVVSGFVVDDRDAADDVVVRFFGDMSGELGAARPTVDGDWNRTVTFSASDTVLTVTATDVDGAESRVEIPVTVYDPTVDHPPSMPVIHIEPTQPITADFLRIAVDTDGVDPDGLPVTYDIRWSIDTIPYPGEVIPTGTIYRGQIVSVEVRSNDGTMMSAPAIQTIEVLNAPPERANVRVGPPSATVLDDLVCEVSGVMDREGDPLLFNYAWTVGGTPVGTSDTLPAGTAAEGEDIVCTAFIDDGFDEAGFSSPVFQIGNAAPGVPGVSILPAAPVDTDDLLCEITTEAGDPDGDPIAYTFAWYRNGDYTGITDPLLPAEETTRDDVWTCEVIATDIGGLPGAPGAATARILPAWYGSEAASAAWATIDGVTADGAFGKNAALVGDVDGDGSGDLLVAASGENGGAGAMYLFSGGSLGGAATTADAMASWAGSWSGGALGGYRSLTAPGDLDGDGYADLVFGAPLASANGSGSGEVYIVYGGGTLTTGTNPSVSADYRFYASTNDIAGVRLTTGDLDGDGIIDLAVSAPGSSGAARSSGAVLILKGGASRFGGSEDLSAVDRTIYGDVELDELGWTLKYVGDVNGDGYGDLFATAMYSDVNGSESGTGALLAGGSILAGTALVGASAEAMFHGATAGDRMGYDVAPAVDVDADGTSDLVMAAYLDDTTGTDAGQVFVYRGRSRWASSYQTTDADMAIAGEIELGRFGHAITAPGDIDGDGRDDLLVAAGYGAPDGLASQGSVYALLGPDWNMYSSAGSLWRSVGDAANDMYGDSVAFGAGDLDGDGRPDMVVGAQGVDAGASNAGRVYVWRGR